MTPGTHLEAAVVRGVEPDVLLGLAYHRLRREAVLPDRAAHRAGDAGLQRGDAHLAVELGTTGLLASLDQQPKAAPISS